ncbi:DnaJ domain-containing protein [Aestuariirhabdus sp. Z084]|uniref:DnaJ domain-containing protein n=1 Tax=Aestuariirhabdus haliotis TaxID=2918751 RepID=UPI00201B43E4|nr:DnaJ domain-containing protein [Aestuariirhabdus haliotis]MCL6414853.1 DnaJ domain-containing protein [Aestuariirhabdus haliotis]MCL6418785.1 DnaJ domain-containing protein [Aestuariirhabdus haliotis]
MQYVLLSLIVAGVGCWLAFQSPAKRRSFFLMVVIAALTVTAVYLLVTGKGAVLIAFFAALLPFARRLLPLLRFLPIFKALWRKRKQSKATSGVSEVVTEGLRMTLDQQSGEMDGEILTGQFAGKMLSELDFESILRLYEYCPPAQQDTRNLLQGYLVKMRSAQWDEYQQCNQSGKGSESSLDEEKAYQILGLNPGASREQIIEAHRRLISKVHPDKGGSAYLAARLNEARSLLLQKVS